jgi:hypothetical protein
MNINFFNIILNLIFYPLYFVWLILKLTITAFEHILSAAYSRIVGVLATFVVFGFFAFVTYFSDVLNS